jgi:hypothetical protein
VATLTDKAIVPGFQMNSGYHCQQIENFLFTGLLVQSSGGAFI